MGSDAAPDQMGSGPWPDQPDLLQLYGLAEAAVSLPPRLALAPGQLAPVVRRRARDPKRELILMRWGWPLGAEGSARPLLTHARSETAAIRPAFRTAFRERRCLVPSNGFYASRRQRRGRQACLIRARDGGLLTFAGLWQAAGAAHPAGAVGSFVIVTTEANEVVRPLQDRMPVILAPSDFERWLDPQSGPLGALLGPCPAALLAACPASPEGW